MSVSKCFSGGLLCVAMIGMTACDGPANTGDESAANSAATSAAATSYPGTSYPGTTLTVDQSQEMLAAAGLKLGSPIKHGRLAVVPVQSIKPRLDDQYLTLDEGLREGTVEVLEKGATVEAQADVPSRAAEQSNQQDADPASEVNAEAGQAAAQPQARDDDMMDDLFGSSPNQSRESSGNQVNEVLVVNRSRKPLYLMPGEIILGGDQDRSIAIECVVAADGKPTPVPVFCVEHGRWGNRQSSANTALLAQVGANIRPDESWDADELEMLSKKADKDQFVASPTVAGKSVRIAVQQAQKQSTVWREVAKVNAKSGAVSASGSLSFNFTQEKTTKLLDPYREALRNPVSDVANVVGVVVVVDGTPQAVDVFSSTPLFKKLWPKLLEGYALDAVTHDEASEVAKYDPEDALCFIGKVLDQSTSGSVRQGTTIQDGDVVVGASAEVSDAYAAEESMVPLHIVGFKADPQSQSDESDPVDQLYLEDLEQEDLDISVEQ